MDEQIQKLIEALREAGKNGTDLSTVGSKRAANEKVIRECLYEAGEAKNLSETMKRRFKLDIFDHKAFPVREGKFSWKKLREKLDAELSEADSASSFVQFLRAGIQNITAGAYESVKTTYEDWVTVVQSSRDTELYAPMHGVAFPRKVGSQMHYPQVGAAALDIKLKNYKYGSMFEVEHELLEDDQTGSFGRLAGQLGEYLKLLCEVLVYGKLAGNLAGLKYLDYESDLSETKPSDEATYPWSTALRGGGRNRPAAFGALLQANIQEAIIALMEQKNLLGIKMQVNPDRFLIGPKLSFDLAVLLNSAYYPSGAAAAGAVGGAFAINPLKGIADVTVSRYMPTSVGPSYDASKAWYLIDSRKPWFVLQMREAISIVQENPQAGESFERDVIRFKARARKNADHLDPRFAWQGNDGSV